MTVAFPVILSSPSGAGKTTIARALLSRRADLGYSVSCTTRAPRDGEVEGQAYHFLSAAEFAARRAREEFAESAQVHGMWYGTLRSEVERVLAAGRHVVLDIDVQGAAQLRLAFPRSVTIFVLPPTGDALLARLRERGTEDAGALQRRLKSALVELRVVPEYQYVVVNDDLERAIARISGIIDAEASRSDRLPALDGTLRSIVERVEREINSKS